MASLIRNCRSFVRCVDFINKRHLVASLPYLQRRTLHQTFVCNYPGVLKDGEDPITLSNKDWEKRLTADQFYVCREKGTELPFTGEYVHNNELGTYSCACCGADLFSSEAKYDSKSGWPSFYQALDTGKKGSDGNILRCSDNSHGMSRIEVVCKQCDAHLGHVFPDGPKPTGERFCINSASLEFCADDNQPS